ncbi:MAG: hypothetical protein ACREMN_10370 [Gemmatimonadales bacterium]
MVDASSDLATRLDGARDLYLLALALGERDSLPGPFGAMIEEARTHFERVIEEARRAGLETGDIAAVLSQHSSNLTDAIRPEIWAALERLMRARTSPR